MHQNRCLEPQCMCRYESYTGVFDTCVHVYVESLCMVCTMRLCMRTLFLSVGGRRWGGSASPCRALVAGVVLFFLI